jgi:hypothetical protein
MASRYSGSGRKAVLAALPTLELVTDFEDVGGSAMGSPTSVAQSFGVYSGRNQLPSMAGDASFGSARSSADGGTARQSRTPPLTCIERQSMTLCAACAKPGDSLGKRACSNRRWDRRNDSPANETDLVMFAR